MIFTDFVILYTPLPYVSFLVILYFLSYLRDPLRFRHPHRERGEEMWPDVLCRLKLITEEEHQQAVQNRRRKVPKGYLLWLSLAAVSPLNGWTLSSFVFSTILFAAAFSLLFQFLSALVILFLVIIPNLGSTAHIWKKHMSHIGSPKKRLGTRILHLVELKQAGKKKQVEEVARDRLTDETHLLPAAKSQELPAGPTTPPALPAVKEEKKEEEAPAEIEQKKENEEEVVSGL